MNANAETPTWEKTSVANPVIKSMLLTHGTAESYDIEKSRQFYEEFLGLSCVRISPESVIFTIGVRFHVVVLALGEEIRPMGLANHWGIQVETKEEVDHAYRACLELKDKYGIRETVEPMEQVWGAYSFFFQDLDHNWWEIEYYPGNLTDDFFAFGDMV
ncbi:VOC family protein [Pseudomonas sp. BF-R-26]|jgi:catechol 2,3-dioxygenase-like lactoylglutathione lyase family enzyme|uniref:VOC family protein n=1 Tax=Pseudomonas sp. BF-R-26 TaxID=2832398 RepID=UPI001CC1B680|nr:VOC family protein [Pseudomonas sp. BF-R-26]